MSLTNDMLNNLDRRNNLNKSNPILFNGLEAAASNKSYYFTYGIYVFMMLLLFGAAFTVFYFTSNYLKSRVVHPIATFKIPVMHFSTPNKNAAQKPMATMQPALANAPVTSMPSTVETTPVKTYVQEPIQDQAQEVYQEALALITQNQTSSAITKLQDIIHNVPNFQDARVTLATLYLENNDLSDATQILTDGLALQPKNLPLTLLYARSLMMESRTQAALSALNNIADVAGNNSTYVDLLASAQESLGNYSEAISLYQSLLKQNPSNARWLVSLGVALEHDGQRIAALEAYKKANSVAQLPLDLQNYVSRRIHDLGG